MKILSGREKDLDDALAIITAQIEQLDIQQIQSTLAASIYFLIETIA